MEHSERERWIRAEADRFWNLSVLRAIHNGRGLPEITVRHSPTKTYTTGFAYHSGRIVVTLGSNVVDQEITMLHELVHAALPNDVNHGELFWRVHRSAAREAWPSVDFAFHRDDSTTGHRRHSWMVVHLTDWIVNGH